MDRTLNKEILRLSIPSILANLTVPLVGFVDTAIAGHLPHGASSGTAAFIGAISIGAMLFNLLYWNFGFLRTGTGGLTAQAFGRQDPHDCARIFVRGEGLALAISAVILLLQWPFFHLVMLFVDTSSEVARYAGEYFFARIWAAPATLSLMAFSGWFVGMQDSMSSMFKDLVVNGVNIVASLVLALGVGSWQGMGFVGIAWGTVIAQYAGLLYCCAVAALKYRKVFATIGTSDFALIFRGPEIKGYFKMNAYLFGRSVFFIVIYIGYTIIAATLGDVLLACSSILMQVLMIFSYFTDGFAYAGEALCGRFIGARDSVMMRRTVRYVFVWSMSIAVVFIALYAGLSTPLTRLLTDDAAVVDTCRTYLPWLLLMPPLGCAAFTWDGIYLGATASKGICLSMMWAAVAFFAVWTAGKLALGPEPGTLMHVLMAAYFAHLAARTVCQSIRYRRDVVAAIK